MNRDVTATLVCAMGMFFATGVEAGPPKYTGVRDCGRCHKKELMGDQLAAWKKAAHSKAFETLKSDDAVEIAKQKGLSTPPYEADECVRCHATAHAVTPDETLRRPLALKDGVQCESCHGPGSNYRKKKVMSDHDKSVAAGMWEPGNDQAICTACHNDESPTWDPTVGFEFADAKEKIAHPIPEDVKGRYLELEKARRAAGKGDGDSEDE